ncbi:MAG: M36 family metallopeptidase [Flavobacteriales bacterium]|nr:M36 family metallopeptidase [Flavobacteriales bacterium]
MLLRSLSSVLLFSAIQLSAQRLPEKVAADLRLAGFHENDLGDLVVKDNYSTAHNGVTHTFFRQRWQGIEVWNGDIAVHQLPNGEVVKLNNGAFTALEKRVNATLPALTPEAALSNVLAKTMPGTRTPPRIGVEDDGRTVLFENSAFAGEKVAVQLVYQPKDGSLRLAWNVNHFVPNGSHWWNVRVDAITGEELDRNDWVVNCGTADHDHGRCDEDPCAAPAPAAPNDYNIYPWPVESPIHGSRAIRNAPWTTGGIASPFGWHDTNGAAGAEFTDTRGNNCYAQDDADANNTGGTRPSGGANLDFDFTLDLTGAPSTYLNVATTNLFYWNNIIHDVWYQYGFDEPAGNFQQNNYGRGGTGNDYVNADAQDGSGHQQRQLRNTRRWRQPAYANVPLDLHYAQPGQRPGQWHHRTRVRSWHQQSLGGWSCQYKLLGQRRADGRGLERLLRPCDDHGTRRPGHRRARHRHVCPGPGHDGCGYPSRSVQHQLRCEQLHVCLGQQHERHQPATWHRLHLVHHAMGDDMGVDQRVRFGPGHLQWNGWQQHRDAAGH